MGRRIAWIDLVKAVSVLLVVFLHATSAVIDAGGPTPAGSLIVDLNRLLEPLRMPVFFLVSGMLASSAIHRPWRASTNRTTGMVYLYLTWVLLFLGLTAAFGAATQPLSTILLAKSGYWYLYAIALFFVIARLARRQPPWLVVALALMPNVLRPVVDVFVNAHIPGSLLTSMGMNLGFFLFGAYFKDLVGGLAARATGRHTWLLGGLAVGLGLLWLDAPQLIGQSYLPLSIVWVAFGVSLAVQVTRAGAPAWAQYVGARTLPIYVLQWPVLFLVGRLLPAQLAHNPLTQLVLPLLLTALVAVLALLAHRQRLLQPLFVAPWWVTRPQDAVAPVRAAVERTLVPNPR
ncbi:MAG TPA: acyltransferase family protein [Actinomycetota bacterium]|nr:acyltransferase family protein [Actinomycetota bacterium]